MGGYTLNNVFVTIGEERKHIAEWCRIYGITRQAVNHRVRVAGWELERAIVTPRRKYRKNVVKEGRKGQAKSKNGG